MFLSIIIPVFNEKNTVLEILKQVEKAKLPKGIEKKEIVIIDDYSTDGTRDILGSIKKKNIKIYYHDKNEGKGSALRTGFSKCSGDIVLIQDADLEYDPQEYSKLLVPIISGKADVVYGSRFIGSEPHRVLYFWHRVANGLLTLCSNMMSDLNITDMETCYKVFRKEVVDKITIMENRFGFEPEITAKVAELARKDDIRIFEIGISYNGRTYNEGKKIGLKDAFRALWCIYKYNTSKFATLIKYGINGLIIALSQFFTIILLVDAFNFKSIFQQNIAYAISIEVSIIFGFILHGLITWAYKFTGIKSVFKKFLLFQLATTVSFIVRQVVFYFLSINGFNYRLNVLIGIAIAVLINFFSYSKIVFK